MPVNNFLFEPRWRHARKNHNVSPVRISFTVINISIFRVFIKKIMVLTTYLKILYLIKHDIDLEGNYENLME